MKTRTTNSGIKKGKAKLSKVIQVVLIFVATLIVSMSSVKSADATWSDITGSQSLDGPCGVAVDSSACM